MGGSRWLGLRVLGRLATRQASASQACFRLAFLTEARQGLINKYFSQADVE